MAHNFYKINEFLIDDKAGTVNILEGRFAFIDQVDHHNNTKNEIKDNSKRTILASKLIKNKIAGIMALENSIQERFNTEIFYFTNTFLIIPDLLLLLKEKLILSILDLQ